jgi:hypothetical protein
MKWKTMVSHTAPLLGSLLSSFLEPLARQLLCKTLLGNERASNADIEEMLVSPTLDQVIMLRQIEAELQSQLALLLTKNNLIQNAVHKRAHLPEIRTQDKIPALLALLLTFGFFGVLFSVMYIRIENDAIHVVDIMLGVLGTAWISCISYYFGSSYSSRLRNQTPLSMPPGSSSNPDSGQEHF